MKMNIKNFMKNRDKSKKIRFQREDLCDSCIEAGAKKVLDDPEWINSGIKDYMKKVFWSANDVAQDCKECIKNYYLHVKKIRFEDDRND